MTVETSDEDDATAADGGSASSRATGEETQTGTETHDVDAVVVATMPDVLESLTGYECAIDFQGSVCAVVSMDESLMDTYWLNIADEAPFGALIEHTNFVSPGRYGGEHLLYVASYIQSPEEALWRMDDEEVRKTWLDGIEDLYPQFDRGSVNWMKIARNPRTAPIYERGYLEMVVPYDLSEVTEGLYYAGMASRAQYPERSLNGGVVAGYECADRILGRK
jgi:protoporphyrinogen oxidase